MNPCGMADDRISLLLDGDLDENAAAGLRAHLEDCADCAALASDLARLREAATSLGPIVPPSGLRERLAGRLTDEAHGRPAHPAPTPDAAPAWLRRVAVVAAAVGMAALVYLSMSRPATIDLAGTPHPLDGVAAELDLALHHYERAIAELEIATATIDAELDDDVVQAVRASLATLDRAIAESRSALVSDPANDAARIALFDALRLKIEVLQATALLLDRPQPPRGALRAVRVAGSVS